MLYKPQFCCNCGDRIERVDWSWLTSRRFCELCETEHKIHDYAPRILVGIGLLSGIFGLGFYWQKAENSLNLSSHKAVGAGAASNKNQANKNDFAQLSDARSQQDSAPKQENNSASRIQSNAQSFSAKQNLTAETKRTETKPTAASETVYFCGAMTKKGTPCTHRVKSGRCWQHAGQPAMLPPEKLIANR